VVNDWLQLEQGYFLLLGEGHFFLLWVQWDRECVVRLPFWVNVLAQPGHRYGREMYFFLLWGRECRVRLLF
jgi:hypothetical protein